jgi:NAD+ synthetase
MASDLCIALAQMNATVGDIEGNAAAVRTFCERAADAGASLVVFPELTLTGYPPEDLLLKENFLARAQAALDDLAGSIRGVTAVIGWPEAAAGHVFNAAAVLAEGGVRAVYRKVLLPNYGVFDERRWFEPGADPVVVEVDGCAVGITICEDMWEPEPTQRTVAAGAELVINLSASPYHFGKGREREQLLCKLAKDNGVRMGFCNLVGGQDEVVFDGHSLIIGPDGVVSARGPQFEEGLVLDGQVAEPLPREEEVYRALVTGVRDYVLKNGFEKVVIASSGGIDSALTILVAVDALGPSSVVTVTMPSRYSSEGTKSDARLISENLGLQLYEIPIEDAMKVYEDLLVGAFKGRDPDLTEENLQARIRGNIVMALSNKFGWLVLTTGNKSEMSVGYATLYGDMAGGFAVLKDVYKQWVYRLVRWRNEQAGRELVPSSVLDRPPSAELRDEQRDDQSLPPYEVLDAILEGYIEGELDADQLAAQGLPEDEVKRVIRLVDLAEYKRRQAPPGIKISTKAFGRDRRLPITNRFRA